MILKENESMNVWEDESIVNDSMILWEYKIMKVWKYCESVKIWKVYIWVYEWKTSWIFETMNEMLTKWNNEIMHESMKVFA